MSAVTRLEAAFKSVYDPTVDTQSPNKLYKKEWPALKAALEQTKDFDDAAKAKLEEIVAKPGVSSAAKRAAQKWLANDSASFRPDNPGPAPAATPIEPQGPWAVFLNDKGELTTDATGKSPATLAELGNALSRAGFWLQDHFDAKTTLFGSKLKLSPEMREKVFSALEAALARDTVGLKAEQARQYKGALGALLVDLLKSTPNGGLGGALHGKVFDAIYKLIDDTATPETMSQLLIARMQDKQVSGSLSSAQKVVNDKALEKIAPKFPLDMTAKARQAAAGGPVTINIDHSSGEGEGFMAGYALALEGQGFKRTDGASGNYHDRPGPYVKRIPAGDPSNKWGVEVVVTMTLRPMRSDIYKGMSDASVDWVSYGGHSNLGRNVMNSLKSAPDQKGWKLIVKDSCCNVDGADAEAEKYGATPSLSSHCSTYFRTKKDSRYGEISYQSEGFDMMMALVAGAVGKKDFAAIEQDLEREANWWGHPTSNNWITPNAWRRRFRELDLDNDGASDLVDAMPSYNTFDIAADTRGEFDLKKPTEASNGMSDRRFFQATRALNTFTNYNPTLEPFNNQRDVIALKAFDAKVGDKEYFRFSDIVLPSGEKVLGVQASTALSDMSVEACRACLFFEYVQHLQRGGKLGVPQEEAILMGLVFAAGALEFDGDYRDREIFDNLKRIYSIPAGVSYNDVSVALLEAEGQRHNYSGDSQAVQKLLGQYRQDGVAAQLKKAGVGAPAVAVS